LDLMYVVCQVEYRSGHIASRRKRSALRFRPRSWFRRPGWSSDECERLLRCVWNWRATGSNRLQADGRVCVH